MRNARWKSVLRTKSGALVACSVVIVFVAAVVTVALADPGRDKSRKLVKAVIVEIVSAIRAPYQALDERKPVAFRNSFVPVVANEVGERLAGGGTCSARVTRAIATTAPFEPTAIRRASSEVSVTDVTHLGSRASARIGDRRQGGPGKVDVNLLRFEGRWRIASPSRLAVVPGCFVGGRLVATCPQNARVLAFLVGSLPSKLNRQRGSAGSRVNAAPTLRARVQVATRRCECAMAHRLLDRHDIDPSASPATN